MNKKHVVVIGSNFAGMSAGSNRGIYCSDEAAAITVVSNDDKFLYTLADLDAIWQAQAKKQHLRCRTCV